MTLKKRTNFSTPKNSCIRPQAAQALFVIYIRDSIALRFEPFQRIMKMVRK